MSSQRTCLNLCIRKTDINKFTVYCGYMQQKQEKKYISISTKKYNIVSQIQVFSVAL